jgi:DNA adenine methylase
MLSILRQYWVPTEGRYIEPFAGSACLFFSVEPKEAILGDLNQDLIRALRNLRDAPDAVFKFMELVPTDEVSYYLLRSQNPDGMIGAMAAARFFVLNRLCFNGLYRTNRLGAFNVPYGRHKSIRMDYDLLRKASELLARATLMNCDFETTLQSARAGDFVFMDPPYVTSSNSSFSEYLPNSFANADLPRLREQLIDLDRRGVSFAITYLNCPEAREMFERWNPKSWMARRNIAGFTAHRRMTEELLATNKENHAFAY